MTVALAGCAFVLSFGALTDLAVSVGMDADRAWLWPCAIDVSIAQSTLALMSLTTGRAKRDTVDDEHVGGPAGDLDSGRLSPVEDTATRATVDVGRERSTAPGDVGRWRPTAQGLVRSGVTQEDAAIVEQILAEHAAGTAPTMIGRHLEVHHSTVKRMLSPTNELAG